MSSEKLSEPFVRIHYLGHASFVLRFGDDLTVLTDYGAPNAWVEWGWNSPIHDYLGPAPDVMTYSHTHHADHYDESRIPPGDSMILKNFDVIEVNGVAIRSFRTSEVSLSEEDNSSFEFTYKGLKILHLGDCQANILAIERAENRKHIKVLFPDVYDLVLMPIEGREKFIPEAERFLHAIRLKSMIPMHYWSDEYKSSFFKHLDDKEGTYRIEKKTGAVYTVSRSDDIVASTTIISLEARPFLG